MKIELKSAFKYALLLIAGLGVFYIAFRNQDLHQIIEKIETANLNWIAVSVLSLFFAHLLRALRWQMLYQSLNLKVSFLNAYNGVMIGYLANLVFPRLGELVRCSVINNTNKVSVFSSLGTVITERLFDVFMLLFSLFLMVILQFEIVSNFLKNYFILVVRSGWPSLLIGVTAFLLLIYFWFTLLKMIKINRKYLKIFISFKGGITAFYLLKEKKKFLAYTMGIWFFYYLSMYLCFFSLQSTMGLGYGAALTAIVFSSIAMVAPVQGGIGVFHYMVAEALLLYSIPFNDALIYATIIHSAQTLLTMALGGLSLGFVFIKNKSNAAIS